MRKNLLAADSVGLDWTQPTELVWPGACAARWAVNLCHGLTHLEVSGHEGGLTILNYLLQSKKQAASPVGDTPLIPGLSVHY